MWKQVEYTGELGRLSGAAVSSVEQVEFLPYDFHSDGCFGAPDVDGEQRDERFKFFSAGVVIDCSAHMAAQTVVDAALRDERGDDDETAVA